MSNTVHDKNYATTRRLVTKKPACFESPVDDVGSIIKMPDSDQKIAEGGLRLRGVFKETSENKPLVTIVTVVYNGEEFLESTIKSVIEQSYENVEYIIVDGGSKDRSLEVIRKYEHAIDYWVSEPDKGIYDAMNKGINLGVGDWVNFMNAGDKFCSNKVLSQIPLKKLGNYGLIYGDKIQNDKIINSFPVTVLESGVIHACHQSMLFRKSASTKEVLRYNLSYQIYSDYDLVARFYKNNLKFFYYQYPISIFQGGGISSVISTQKRKDKYFSIFYNFGVVGILRALIHRFF